MIHWYFRSDFFSFFWCCTLSGFGVSFPLGFLLFMGLLRLHQLSFVYKLAFCYAILSIKVSRISPMTATCSWPCNSAKIEVIR